MLQTIRRRRREGQRGAALVEFALILPIFMSLALGIFTGGIAYNRQVSMTNAVREGARFGATLNAGAGWETPVRERVENLSAGDLELGQICVKLVEAPSTPIYQTSCPAALAATEPVVPPGTASGTCVVKVWAARTSNFQALFFSRDLNLRAQAVSRYERPNSLGPCS